MTAPAGEQQQQDSGKSDGGKADAQQQNDSGNSGGGGTFTQAQLNAIVAQTRRETESKFGDYDEVKSKAAQLDQLTDAAQSDLERANNSANEFKSKWEAEQSTSKKLQTELLRQKISATNHLDPDLWDRVAGDTAEEIEADVKKLVEKFGTSGGSTRQSRQFQSGASAPPDGSSKKERAAAGLRAMTR